MIDIYIYLWQFNYLIFFYLSSVRGVRQRAWIKQASGFQGLCPVANPTALPLRLHWGLHWREEKEGTSQDSTLQRWSERRAKRQIGRNMHDVPDTAESNCKASHLTFSKFKWIYIYDCFSLRERTQSVWSRSINRTCFLLVRRVLALWSPGVRQQWIGTHGVATISTKDLWHM